MKLLIAVADLQVELTSLLEAVQETETKMVEMSALNHLMATHVLHQAQQIEQLYDQVQYRIHVHSSFFFFFNLFLSLLYVHSTFDLRIPPL